MRRSGRVTGTSTCLTSPLLLQCSLALRGIVTAQKRLEHRKPPATLELATLETNGDGDRSSTMVAVPPSLCSRSGWNGFALAYGFLVVEGVAWALAACGWTLSLGVLTTVRSGPILAMRQP